MLFNSYLFLGFFALTVLIYFILPAGTRYIWLAAAGIMFYISSDWRYIIPLMYITTVSYIAGRLIGQSEKNGKKIMCIGCILTAGALFVYKYLDFAVMNIVRVAARLNFSITDKSFNLLLPLGISFYTLSAISYMVDVYEKRENPERNFLKYLLYISYFPKMLAGPIERSGEFISQIDCVTGQNRRRLFDYDRITGGMMLMLWGYFLKLVVADRAAVLVDNVFGSYYRFGGVELIIGAVCFGIQIYCDFAGYSYIAIGCSEILGFRLMDNFMMPYFAVSVKDFWRRWHISLSTWLRDYIYIPLGGSRCSKMRKYLNIFITFMVSGLWHGAAWTYIVWGMLHGFYQIIEDCLRPVKRRFDAKYNVRTGTTGYRVLRMIVTFILVDFAWIFFKSAGIGDALRFVQRIFVHMDPWVLADGSVFFSLGLSTAETEILLIAVLILLAADIIQYRTNKNFSEYLSGQCLVFRWLVILAVLFMVLIWGEYGPGFDSARFLYTQF
jgi:alginate O-acetyltransferase complex protein AlgI